MVSLMNNDTLLAFITFSIVTSVTPGPNNIMLLTSGVNFGFKRTIPHTLGISGGFSFLLLATGFGLGYLLKTFSIVHLVLKILGSAYLLYLALRTAMSRTLSQKKTAKTQPMTFMEAALFQWVNPKAWFMAMSAMALYTNPQQPFFSMLIVTIIFTLLNWPSVSIWAIFGTALRKFLSEPVRLKWFNITMGALLAFSVVLLVQ